MEENTNQNLFGEHKEDDLHIALKVVSFCVPIVGAILYFVKKNDEPKSAKQACNLALIGFGVGLVLNILSYILFPGAFAQ